MATTAAESPGPAAPWWATFGPNDRAFVDTNVLVYSTVPTAPLVSQARAALTHLHAAGVSLWTSRQILREYTAAMTRPQSYAPASPMATVFANLRKFQSDFTIAEDGPATFARLLALLSAIPCGGKQVHDANIVATMLAHGVPNLLTHNVADFTRFAGHVTVVPLVP